MTLDWPTAAVVIASLAAACVALKVALPYIVGHSTAQAREAALKNVNDRLDKVEGALATGTRRMPGRLG